MNFFRKHLDSKFVKIIAFFIIAIFISWEFTSQSLRNPNSWLIKVGDIEYGAKDWKDTYNALIKDPMSSQEALMNPIYAKKRVLEEMIQNALILQEAERIGFSVNDRIVASEVVHMKIFKNENGKFDKALLEKVLKMNNLTESEFIQNMKERLLRNHLMDMFYNTSNLVGAPVYNLLTKLIAAEQNISLYKLNLLQDKVEYSDDDLKKYMEENKKQFMTNDVAKISKLLFSSANIKLNDITEQEIQEYYETSATTEPEQRIVNQIVISSYNEAQTVLENIKANKLSYDKAALPYANSQMIPYEIGPFSKDGFDEDIAKIVFTLPKNGISDLVQTPIGWHIFKVKEIIPEKKQELSIIKSDIVKELIKKQRLNEMHNLVKNVMTDIESNASIQDIAQKYQLKISESIEEVKRTDDNTIDLFNIPEEDKENGISKRKILQASFAEGDKIIHLISADDKESFMLLYTNEIIKGTMKDFDEVKVNLIDSYTEFFLKNKTENLAKEIRKNVLDAKYNDESALKVDTTFSRVSKNTSLPVCIQNLILKMHKDGIFNSVTLPCQSDNAYYFAELRDFNFSKEISNDERTALKKTVNSIYNEIIFDQFMENLKKRYKVEFSEDFMKYINSDT